MDENHGSNFERREFQLEIRIELTYDKKRPQNR